MGLRSEETLELTKNVDLIIGIMTHADCENANGLHTLQSRM